jgi:thiamine pyrophosphokinase
MHSYVSPAETQISFAPQVNWSQLETKKINKTLHAYKWPLEHWGYINTVK